jgi:tetratricopeptide (TPR) repeat protein
MVRLFGPLVRGALAGAWPLVLAAAIAPARAQGPAEAAALGDRRMAEGSTESAIEAYRAGIVGRPDDPELLWKTARALSNLADETPGEAGDEARMEEAVELSRRAVRFGPTISRTHTTLAASLGKLALFRGGRRKVELAREVGREARKAAELDPRDFAPFAVLGVLERELATLNPLLRGFASALFGGLPDASLERSAALLERSVRLGPAYVAPHLELARTYVEMDREEEARAELQRALAARPTERLDRVLQERARELLRELD